jgi:hypothetical protein
MPDNQTIKKDKKYKFTPLEKRFIKIYLLLAVFYSIVSVYLLNTPIAFTSKINCIFFIPSPILNKNSNCAYKNKPKNPLIQNIQWYHFFSNSELKDSVKQVENEFKDETTTNKDIPSYNLFIQNIQ